MFSKMVSSRSFFAIVFGGVCVLPAIALGNACVWKVSSPSGGTLYLGGSVHMLRSTDYPLPPEYSRAFDVSSKLVFEADPKILSSVVKGFLKAGRYGKGDTLKNHVDPRTYDYLRRFFALQKVPEEKFNMLRPWFIVMLLESPPREYIQLGVEAFLARRAQANSKAISGLESLQEAMESYSGLSDRQSEALLLVFFINAARSDSDGIGQMMKAWRQGDAETLTHLAHGAYSDFPAMGERLLGARNRKWIPKIEGYLRSGQTYFVVAGAAHMGGSEGLLALLQARGYKVEQL